MRNGTYDRILSQIETIGKHLASGNTMSSEDVLNVLASVKDINSILVGFPTLGFQKQWKLDTPDAYIGLGKELICLVNIWREIISHQKGIKPDVDFWNTYYKFKYVSVDEIVADAISKYLSLDEDARRSYIGIEERYTFLSATINPDTNDYSLFSQHAKMMAENIDKYRWLYNQLSDYRSKETLTGIINCWFDFSRSKRDRLREYLFHDYFDLDLVNKNADEVMVDCGAFVGDSILDFINTYYDYKQIYAFEMTPSAFASMSESLSIYPNVKCINKAVGNECSQIHISNSLYAGNNINNTGDVEIEMTTIDKEIAEPVTMIKMDIEGAEKSALIGAKNHIVNDKPRLLISAYHIPEDIFEIPTLISEMRDDYKFYLRYNGRGIWPCDYVIIAV